MKNRLPDFQLFGSRTQSMSTTQSMSSMAKCKHDPKKTAHEHMHTVHREIQLSKAIGSMAAPLPLQPEEGIAEFATVLKSFPDALKPAEWALKMPARGMNTSMFLRRPTLNKPELRQAVKLAKGSLTISECKLLATAFHEVVSYLKKRKRNLKTGGKTPPHIQRLLAIVDVSMKKKKSEEGQANKSLKQKMVPEEGKGKRPKLIIAEPAEEEEPQPTEVWDVESSVAGTQSSSMVRPEELIAACRRLEVKQKPAAKEPDILKKPAAQEPVILKKPAAKPAEGKAKDTEPAEGIAKAKLGKSWAKSVSFGWVKQTRAMQKAYIQAMPEEGKKVYCLVNVEVVRGPLQTKVMDKLWDKACNEASLEKAALVDFKKAMLKPAENVD